MIEIDIPWYAYVISLVIAAGNTWFLYRNDIHSNWGWKISALLRFLATTILVLLFFSPSFHIKSFKEVNPKLIVYQDVSNSVDSSSEFALKSTLSGIKREFSDNLEIENFAFARDVYSSTDTILSAHKNRTQLDEVINHFNNKTQDQSVVGAILISDGILNLGQKPSTQKLSKKYPIFSIGLGDSTEYPDLKLSSVFCNEQVAKGNSLIVEVAVEAHNCASNSAIIQIKEGQKVVSQKQWNYNSKKDWAKYSFELTPQHTGFVNYVASILPLSVGEKNTLNNAKSFGIQVVEKNTKIHIVFSRPHADIKALQLALKSKANFTIETYPISEGIKSTADLYIFHGGSESKLVTSLVQQNKPMWIFVNTPTMLRLFADQTHSECSSVQNFQWQEVQGIANSSFELFRNEDNPTKWKSLGVCNAPLTKIKPNAGLNVQLTQCWNGIVTGFPLQCNSNEENTRICWFIGEGIWHWRMNENRKSNNSELFDDWVNKNVQWLSNSSSLKKEITVQLQQPVIEPGEDLVTSIKRIDQLGQPDNSVNLNVFLIDSSGKKIPVSYSRQGKIYQSYTKINALGTFRIRAELANNSSVFDEKLVRVNPSNEEISHKVADFNLLRNISQSSGGLFAKPQDLNPIWNRIKDLSLNKSKLITSIRNLLWNEIAWILLVVVLLFSGEWFLRKWLGKI